MKISFSALLERVSRLRRRKVPVVLQAEMLECAHACLAMVVSYHGHSTTLEEVRARFTPPARGTSVSSLVDMGHELGLNTRVFRAEPVHLSQIALPCVLHWDVVHFVVLESLDNGTYTIVDPAVGRVVVCSAELDRRFTGIVIEMTPRLGFAKPQKAVASSALTLLYQGFKEQRSTLVVVVVLAILLELLSLAAPLLIQAVTDSILPAGDTQLLLLLLAAFAVSCVLQALISFSRSSLLIRLGERLTVGWNAEVCSRLFRLPYIFFVRRSIGDIHSRFGSIAEIQRTVTHKFVAGVLDGATALLSLGIIVIYSPLLAGVTLLFTLMYGIFRVATLSHLVQATERSIRLEASQQGLLLEILHGIHSIKASGTETTKLARYTRKTRDAAHAAGSVQGFSGTVDEIGQTILRLHWIAAVGAGALLALEGTISAGMLVAYVTYAYQFSVRSTRLLELLSEWRMLLLHGNRLADLVTEIPQPEQELDSCDLLKSDIAVKGVEFAYDDAGPKVLNGVDLVVAAGECVAIKGPSGCGKTTLAKLIIGLLEPQSGLITVGGVPLPNVPRRVLRSHIACVLQDDQLFNGTIAENIAFFEPGFARDEVIAAAKLAQIHNEVMAMPLRYESRIIDLGASLSGGQRQRLILARALFRKPRILVLDEASSHLDLANERLVNEAISALSVTRIIIAHRPETLAIADRVVELRGGVLTQPLSASSIAGTI